MYQGIRSTDEIKHDAVAQAVKRAYAVSETVKRFGINTMSPHTWKASAPNLTKNTRVVLSEVRHLKPRCCKLFILHQ